MPRKKEPLPVPQSRIIVDCRDGTRDYFLPTARARELYNQGLLGWDLTNGTYTILHPLKYPR